MHPFGFQDRSASLNESPEQLSEIANLLSSPTRLSILSVLTGSRDPLNINEVARRVGVDASPVRTHLELLVRAGIVREVSAGGRERRFVSFLKNVRLTLEGVNRTSAPERDVTPSKTVKRLQRKLSSVEENMTDLVQRAQKLQRAIEAEWAKAGSGSASTPSS